MRLLKLIAYSLLGYVVYELFVGITEGAESRSSDSTEQWSRGVTRRDAGATTGGSGERRSTNVEDAGGGQATRTAGHGVIH
jgi:hypothetical protein